MALYNYHIPDTLYLYSTVTLWEFLRGLYKASRAALLRSQQITPSICHAKCKKTRPMFQARRMMFCRSGYLPTRIRRIRKSI